MSFISNLIGSNNGYTVQSGAGSNNVEQQKTDTTNLNNVFGQQSDLAKQLLAQTQGAGPNIADLQLKQATNQNNQQAAGAIASQKGMNPALAARIIANQQAMNNQNAAGQSGVLRAQQQLAAQQGLANVYGEQAGEAQNNFNTITQANAAANQANAGIAQSNANQAGQLAGGLLGGAASILAASSGGEIKTPQKHLQDLLISIGNKVRPKHFYDGGSTQINTADPLDSIVSEANLDEAANPTYSSTGPGSFSKFANGFSAGYKNSAAASSPLSSAPSPIFGNVPTNSPMPQNMFSNINIPLTALSRAKGGSIPVMLSPGELRIHKKDVASVLEGRKKASEVGDRVPGKAKVKGDSLKNDTFATYANSGDVIVKRTKAQNDKDAREFLLEIEKEKARKNGPSGYAKILAMKRNKSA